MNIKEKNQESLEKKKDHDTIKQNRSEEMLIMLEQIQGNVEKDRIEKEYLASKNQFLLSRIRELENPLKETATIQKQLLTDESEKALEWHLTFDVFKPEGPVEANPEVFIPVGEQGFAPDGIKTYKGM